MEINSMFSSVYQYYQKNPPVLKYATIAGRPAGYSSDAADWRKPG